MNCSDDEPLVEADDKAKLEAIKKAVIGKWMLTNVTLESIIPSGQITEDTVNMVIPQIKTIKIYREGYIFQEEGRVLKLKYGGSMEHWTYDVVQKKKNYYVVVISNGDELDVTSNEGDVDGLFTLSLREMYINSFFHLIYSFEKTL